MDLKNFDSDKSEEVFKALFKKFVNDNTEEDKKKKPKRISDYELTFPESFSLKEFGEKIENTKDKQNLFDTLLKLKTSDSKKKFYRFLLKLIYKDESFHWKAKWDQIISINKNYFKSEEESTIRNMLNLIVYSKAKNKDVGSESDVISKLVTDEQFEKEKKELEAKKKEEKEKKQKEIEEKRKKREEEQKQKRIEEAKQLVQKQKQQKEELKKTIQNLSTKWLDKKTLKNKLFEKDWSPSNLFGWLLSGFQILYDKLMETEIDLLEAGKDKFLNKTNKDKIMENENVIKLEYVEDLKQQFQKFLNKEVDGYDAFYESKLLKKELEKKQKLAQEAQTKQLSDFINDQIRGKEAKLKTTIANAIDLTNYEFYFRKGELHVLDPNYEHEFSFIEDEFADEQVIKTDKVAIWQQNPDKFRTFLKDYISLLPSNRFKMYKRNMCENVPLTGLGFGVMETYQRSLKFWASPANPNKNFLIYAQPGTGKTCIEYAIQGNYEYYNMMNEEKEDRKKLYILVPNDTLKKDVETKDTWCFSNSEPEKQRLKNYNEETFKKYSTVQNKFKKIGPKNIDNVKVSTYNDFYKNIISNHVDLPRAISKDKKKFQRSKPTQPNKITWHLYIRINEGTGKNKGKIGEISTDPKHHSDREYTTSDIFVPFGSNKTQRVNTMTLLKSNLWKDKSKEFTKNIKVTDKDIQNAWHVPENFPDYLKNMVICIDEAHLIIKSQDYETISDTSLTAWDQAEKYLLFEKFVNHSYQKNVNNPDKSVHIILSTATPIGNNLNTITRLINIMNKNLELHINTTQLREYLERTSSKKVIKPQQDEEDFVKLEKIDLQKWVMSKISYIDLSSDTDHFINLTSKDFFVVPNYKQSVLFQNKIDKIMESDEEGEEQKIVNKRATIEKLRRLENIGTEKIPEHWLFGRKSFDETLVRNDLFGDTNLTPNLKFILRLIRKLDERDFKNDKVLYKYLIISDVNEVYGANAMAAAMAAVGYNQIVIERIDPDIANMLDFIHTIQKKDPNVKQANRLINRLDQNTLSSVYLAAKEVSYGLEPETTQPSEDITPELPFESYQPFIIPDGSDHKMQTTSSKFIGSNAAIYQDFETILETLKDIKIEEGKTRITKQGKEFNEKLKQEWTNKLKDVMKSFKKQNISEEDEIGLPMDVDQNNFVLLSGSSLNYTREIEKGLRKKAVKENGKDVNYYDTDYVFITKAIKKDPKDGNKKIPGVNKRFAGLKVYVQKNTRSGPVFAQKQKNEESASDSRILKAEVNLENFGIENDTKDDDFTFLEKLGLVVWKPDLGKKEKNAMKTLVKEQFNSENNKFGERARFAVASGEFKQGIDFKDCKYLIKINKSKNKSDEIQTDGRIHRRCGTRYKMGDDGVWDGFVFNIYLKTDTKIQNFDEVMEQVRRPADLDTLSNVPNYNEQEDDDDDDDQDVVEMEKQDVKEYYKSIKPELEQQENQIDEFLNYFQNNKSTIENIKKQDPTKLKNLKSDRLNTMIQQESEAFYSEFSQSKNIYQPFQIWKNLDVSEQEQRNLERIDKFLQNNAFNKLERDSSSIPKNDTGFQYVMDDSEMVLIKRIYSERIGGTKKIYNENQKNYLKSLLGTVYITMTSEQSKKYKDKDFYMYFEPDEKLQEILYDKVKIKKNELGQFSETLYFLNKNYKNNLLSLFKQRKIRFTSTNLEQDDRDKNSMENYAMQQIFDFVDVVNAPILYIDDKPIKNQNNIFKRTNLSLDTNSFATRLQNFHGVENISKAIHEINQIFFTHNQYIIQLISYFIPDKSDATKVISLIQFLYFILFDPKFYQQCLSVQDTKNRKELDMKALAERIKNFSVFGSQFEEKNLYVSGVKMNTYNKLIAFVNRTEEMKDVFYDLFAQFHTEDIQKLKFLGVDIIPKKKQTLQSTQIFEQETETQESLPISPPLRPQTVAKKPVAISSKQKPKTKEEIEQEKEKARKFYFEKIWKAYQEYDEKFLNFLLLILNYKSDMTGIRGYDSFQDRLSVFGNVIYNLQNNLKSRKPKSYYGFGGKKKIPEQHLNAFIREKNQLGRGSYGEIFLVDVFDENGDNRVQAVIKKQSPLKISKEYDRNKYVAQINFDTDVPQFELEEIAFNTKLTQMMFSKKIYNINVMYAYWLTNNCEMTEISTDQNGRVITDQLGIPVINNYRSNCIYSLFEYAYYGDLRNFVTGTYKVNKIPYNILTKFISNDPQLKQQQIDTMTETLIFQLMYSLASINYNLQATHDDIAPRNILVYETDPGGYWQYKLFDKTYYIPNNGYMFALADFGAAKTFDPKLALEIGAFPSIKTKYFPMGQRFITDKTTKNLYPLEFIETSLKNPDFKPYELNGFTFNSRNMLFADMFDDGKLFKFRFKIPPDIKYADILEKHFGWTIPEEFEHYGESFRNPGKNNVDKYLKYLNTFIEKKILVQEKDYQDFIKQTLNLSYATDVQNIIRMILTQPTGEPGDKYQQLFPIAVPDSAIQGDYIFIGYHTNSATVGKFLTSGSIIRELKQKYLVKDRNEKKENRSNSYKPLGWSRIQPGMNTYPTKSYQIDAAHFIDEYFQTHTFSKEPADIDKQGILANIDYVTINNFLYCFYILKFFFCKINFRFCKKKKKKGKMEPPPSKKQKPNLPQASPQLETSKSGDVDKQQKSNVQEKLENFKMKKFKFDPKKPIEKFSSGAKPPFNKLSNFNEAHIVITKNTPELKFFPKKIFEFMEPNKNYKFLSSEHLYQSMYSTNKEEFLNFTENGKWGKLNWRNYLHAELKNFDPKTTPAKNKTVKGKIKTFREYAEDKVDFWSTKNNVGIIAKKAKNTHLKTSVLQIPSYDTLWMAVLYLKYSQNPEHKQILKDTGTTFLYEFDKGAKSDTIYGAKISENKLIGQNKMGQYHMNLRELLFD